MSFSVFFHYCSFLPIRGRKKIYLTSYLNPSYTKTKVSPSRTLRW
nr:MAG TPA: hypothetical protein [Caudoviricetes sp.]